jgi:ATP-binding cassette subfamily B protein
MKYQHQIDETDCGPACISMVASHYKLYVTIGNVRELSKTDYTGTNLMGTMLLRKAQERHIHGLYMPRP